ncbi:hypothetical protein V1478_015258 [Vespula squamosa]|uniref:Uncharacterized protein n=1 Tax=Vespula squamosa TaxID=30214 RepID=A0ABD2A4L2_VESSQ
MKFMTCFQFFPGSEVSVKIHLPQISDAILSVREKAFQLQIESRKQYVYSSHLNVLKIIGSRHNCVRYNIE